MSNPKERPGKHSVSYCKDAQQLRNPAEEPCYDADNREYENRKQAVDSLRERIIAGTAAEDALWQAIVTYQGYPLYTSSGLPFRYTVKRNRDGEYSGELVISRKEDSKTLTRSSVMLAFRKIVGEIAVIDVSAGNDACCLEIVPPEYKGPKAIGQIFGISYVYSLFWKLGLIKVPAKVENKLRGKK